MQYFAVILASIAALAATTQAYLLWSNPTESDAERIHLERVQACESVVGTLRLLQRQLEGRDEYLKAALENFDPNYFAPRYGPVADEDAKMQTIEDTFFDVMGVLAWVTIDSAAIYFSDEEFVAIGVKELTELREIRFRRTYRVPTDIQLKYFEAAAAKFDSALAVCTPIMLGKAV